MKIELSLQFHPMTRSRKKSTRFRWSIRLAEYSPAATAVNTPTPITKSITENGTTGITYMKPPAISLIV